MQQQHGTIKCLVRDRGFGFISDAAGTDFFFHMSDVRIDSPHFDDLVEGAPVTFDVEEMPKGPRARCVGVTL